jgi:hypothetical protein
MNVEKKRKLNPPLNEEKLYGEDEAAGGGGGNGV